MKKVKIAGIAFVFLGIALLLNSAIGITGLAIADSDSGFKDIVRVWGFVGAVFIMIGGVLIWESAVAEERKVRKSGLELGVEKVGNLKYGHHALDRLGERHLYPGVIENAIKNGEHYPLTHITNFGEARGATDVYIIRHGADIAPGGRTGERILRVGEKKEYKNILVLTGKEGVVKTAYVRNDVELESFMNHYVNPREKKKVA